jgi:NADPH:quinone reductase-like Zn-dependent oxidoreductase
MFALLLCLAASIRPIITSSSDKKLDIARSLGPQGAVDVINYTTHPKWDEEALRLTNGRGVDIVLENVGATTIAQSLASLAKRGIVSLIGFLGGFNLDRFPNTIEPILVKSATVKFVPDLALY